MYTKARGISENAPTVPPPGYGGNRFRQRKNYDLPANDSPSEQNCAPLSFLSSVGQEELLIIALIMVLCGEGEKVESDTVLMLLLLLLIR